ncbi:hypothetical protein HAX54_045639 [Datura stramonium]|uniref:Uncharacterized protein n=1 Tax=Datura stramonium TaxID=4076 RepID=A0ABS8RRL4_DATST|nr:hypothetical protein [Datura stramonium]
MLLLKCRVMFSELCICNPQLADTDGSSIIPPSVNRVLNNKACRSAIMFGDALLPSECSLIVEELKQTSLCFQVSGKLHFRKQSCVGTAFDGIFKERNSSLLMTAISFRLLVCSWATNFCPSLVNLDALHEQIAKLGSWSRGSSEAWHGLYRHEINLERAAKRLRSDIS